MRTASQSGSRLYAIQLDATMTGSPSLARRIAFYYGAPGAGRGRASGMG
jgi:hypothetical protein